MKGFLLKNKWKRILSLAMASSMIFSTMSTALATELTISVNSSSESWLRNNSFVENARDLGSGFASKLVIGASPEFLLEETDYSMFFTSSDTRIIINDGKFYSFPFKDKADKWVGIVLDDDSRSGSMNINYSFKSSPETVEYSYYTKDGTLVKQETITQQNSTSFMIPLTIGEITCSEFDYIVVRFSVDDTEHTVGIGLDKFDFDVAANVDFNFGGAIQQTSLKMSSPDKKTVRLDWQDYIDNSVEDPNLLISYEIEGNNYDDVIVTSSILFSQDSSNPITSDQVYEDSGIINNFEEYEDLDLSMVDSEIFVDLLFLFNSEYYSKEVLDLHCNYTLLIENLDDYGISYEDFLIKPQTFYELRDQFAPVAVKTKYDTDNECETIPFTYPDNMTSGDYTLSVIPRDNLDSSMKFFTEFLALADVTKIYDSTLENPNLGIPTEFIGTNEVPVECILVYESNGKQIPFSISIAEGKKTIDSVTATDNSIAKLDGKSVYLNASDFESSEATIIIEGSLFASFVNGALSNYVNKVNTDTHEVTFNMDAIRNEGTVTMPVHGYRFRVAKKPIVTIDTQTADTIEEFELVTGTNVITILDNDLSNDSSIILNVENGYILDTESSISQVIHSGDSTVYNVTCKDTGDIVYSIIFDVKKLDSVQKIERFSLQESSQDLLIVNSEDPTKISIRDLDKDNEVSLIISTAEQNTVVPELATNEVVAKFEYLSDTRNEALIVINASNLEDTPVAIIANEDVFTISSLQDPKVTISANGEVIDSAEKDKYIVKMSGTSTEIFINVENGYVIVNGEASSSATINTSNAMESFYVTYANKHTQAYMIEIYIVEEIVNTEALESLVAEGNAIIANEDDYSTFNFEAFKLKLEEATEYINTLKADTSVLALTYSNKQEVINTLVAELTNLRDSLINIKEYKESIAAIEEWATSVSPEEVNDSLLQDLIADINAAKESIRVVSTISEAETIVSSLESKKEEVALSTPEVDNSEAIAALKEELDALVSEANSILTILNSDSPEKHFIFMNGLTKEAFEVEVTSAEEVLANVEPTIESLTEAVNSLKDSIANIVDITEQKAIYDAIKAEFEEIKADSTGYSEEKIAMASDAIMGLEVALNNYNPEDTSSWDDALANAQAKMKDLKNSYTAPAPPLTVEELLAKMQEQYDRYEITEISKDDYNDRSWALYSDHFAEGRYQRAFAGYSSYWLDQKDYDPKYEPLYRKSVKDILNQVDKSDLTVEVLQIWVEEGEIYHNGLLNVKDLKYEMDEIQDELNGIWNDLEHYTERLYDIADDQWYTTYAAIDSAKNMNIINVAMDQLRTAMEDLRNSYSGEVNVDKTALEREIAEAKPTYDAGNANGKYSTETWENFVEAYENAQTVLLSAKLQVQLDNAASWLNDAFNNLVVVNPDAPTPEEPKFDTSALAAKVAEVKPVYDIGNETLIYTLESWDAFDKAYRAATALLAPEATIESQEVVDRALATLTTAYASLVLDTPENPEDNISYAALEAIIAANSTVYEAGNVNTDGSQKYTVSSWNAFVTAYDSAVAMAEAKNAASQDIVNNLVSVLTNAKNSLELFVPETEIVDKAALEAALAKYKDLYDGNNSNGKYTETSFKLFKNAYAAALLEKDSSSSTKESVANAVKILDNMFKQLIPADMGGSGDEGEGQNPGGSGDTVVVDTSKLKATVDTNRGTYNTNNLTGVYTETSFARFKVAFEMAVDVLNNPKASQEVVDLTLSQLESAIKGMTLAGSNDQYNVTVYSEDVNLRPGSILDSPFVYTVSKFPYSGNSTLIFRIKTPGFVSQNHDIKLLVDGNPAAGLSLSTTNLTMANRPVENGGYADLIFKLNWSVANPMSADTPVRLVIDGRTVFFDDLDMTILAANAPEDTQKPDEDETQKPDDTQKPDKDETQKPDDTQKPDKDEDDDDKESIVSRVFSLRDVGEEIEAMAKGDVLELELWPKTAISVDVLNILKDSSKTLSFVNEESDLPYVWSIYGKDIRTTNLKKDAYSLLIDFDDESYFSGDLEDILYENCVVAEFEHGSTRFSSQIAIDTEFNRKEINIYQVIDEDDEILEWVGSTKSTNKGIVEFETDEYGTIVLSTRLLPKAYVVNYNDSLGKDDTTNEGTTDVTIDGSIVSIPNSSINADGTISINGKDMTIEELEDALSNGDITEEQIEDLLDVELDGFMSLLESIFGGIFNGTGEVVGGEINGGAVNTPSRPGGQVSNAVTGGLSTQVLEDRVDDSRDDVIRAGVATICVVAFAGAVTLVLLKKRTEEE